MKHIDKNDYCCDNTWLKHCNNKTFTYGQLLGAMKFNIVKYHDLPDDVKPKMFEYLDQQGYLRSKK